MGQRHGCILLSEGNARIVRASPQSGGASAERSAREADVQTLDFDPDAPAAKRASLIAAAMRQSSGGGSQTVVLGLPSGWCLSASFEAGAEQRALKDAALLFQLEDRLPAPAEELAADFLRRPGHVWGVAVEIERVRPVIEGLESEGVEVEAVVPTALLALQGLLRDAAGSPVRIVLLGSGDGIELFVLEEGQLAAWSHLPSRHGRILQALQVIARGSDDALPLAAVGIEGELLERIRSSGVVEVAEVVGVGGEGLVDLVDLVAETAARVLSGREAALVDLRRGRLAPASRLRRIRGSLAAAAAAVILLLTATAGAMLWRSHEYDHLAVAAQEQQRAAYRQLFPNRPDPIDPLLLLESEARRLQGTHASGSLPARPSVLPSLHDLLSRLPRDLRFRLLEIRFDESRLLLDGQARSHADVDAVAAALREGAAFDVEPPQSEQRSQRNGEEGVSFVLSATTRPPGESRPGDDLEPSQVAGSPADPMPQSQAFLWIQP